MAPSKAQKLRKDINVVKAFQKTIIEGKTSEVCAKEIGVHEVTVRQYRRTADYRQMAIAYLDDQVEGGGLKGATCILAEGLNAVKPHNKETKNADGSTNIEVVFVTDTNARLKAVQEVHKIYGVHAPQKRDITVAVSISSDAELFAAIKEADRVCQYVDSYEKREGGFELAPDPQGASSGNFKSRKRTLLQGTSVPE